MSKIELEKIKDVATALRGRAAYFYKNSPEKLSKEDFGTIGSYLEAMADTLDKAVRGDKRKSFWFGFASFLLYLLLFAGLGWFFYQYSPYEDRYYLKLAKEIFSESDAPGYVFYIRGGIAGFCALFLFFVSVFVSIVFCGVLKLALPKLINALVEAALSIVLAGIGCYFYHEYVFTTGLAKTFL